MLRLLLLREAAGLGATGHEGFMRPVSPPALQLPVSWPVCCPCRRLGHCCQHGMAQASPESAAGDKPLVSTAAATAGSVLGSSNSRPSSSNSRPNMIVLFRSCAGLSARVHCDDAMPEGKGWAAQRQMRCQADDYSITRTMHGCGRALEAAWQDTASIPWPHHNFELHPSRPFSP